MPQTRHTSSKIYHSLKQLKAIDDRVFLDDERDAYNNAVADLEFLLREWNARLPDIQAIERDAYNRDKGRWIKQNGSEDLKHRFYRGYDCNYEYLEERANHEFPGFKVFRSKPRMSNSDYPSDHALDILQRLEQSGTECKAVDITNKEGDSWEAVVVPQQGWHNRIWIIKKTMELDPIDDFNQFDPIQDTEGT